VADCSALTWQYFPNEFLSKELPLLENVSLGNVEKKDRRPLTAAFAQR